MTPLPPAAEARLRDYAALLARWNRRIALVSRADAAQLWERHILDCWQLLPLLPAEGPVADMGSGAGLPGLVLAIGRAAPMHLVESDRRKAAFLVQAAQQLGLGHVTVHAARMEEARLPPLAVFTARAVAPVAQLWPIAARRLLPDGVAVLPRGDAEDLEADLALAQDAAPLHVERFPSVTHPNATILRLRPAPRPA